MVEAILARLDLLHDTIIRPLPHPLWAPGRYSIRSAIVGPELLMKPRQAVMRASHWPVTLHRIAEAVAVAARKQLSGKVDLCNPSAAINPIGVNVADKPRTLSAEAAGSPSDRHPLLDGLPIVSARSNTVAQSDSVPTACDPDRSGRPVPIRPLPATERQACQIAGTGQLHYTERPAALYRASTLPVVATARHRILFA